MGKNALDAVSFRFEPVYAAGAVGQVVARGGVPYSEDNSCVVVVSDGGVTALILRRPRT